MDRMTDLEVKIAFLEQHLLELDGVVRDLASRLERATNELAELRDAPANSEKPNSGHERPPHYDQSLVR